MSGIAARKARQITPSPTASEKKRRTIPQRVSAAQKFAGLTNKSVWRQDADAVIEALLARLDNLAADQIQERAIREFHFLDHEQWIKLLQLISHALFPEVFTRIGQEPSHEGLIPAKGGSSAFPLTPRRLRALLSLMQEWDN